MQGERGTWVIQLLDHKIRVVGTVELNARFAAKRVIEGFG
jgi:hypothetical protein